MSQAIQGELTPVGGGDSIPLIRESLMLGRLDSCDICLRLPNVSKHHCRMLFSNGFWYLEDMGSTNGTKVNGIRITGRKLLQPGDTVTIAKRSWIINYDAPSGRPIVEDIMTDDILSQPLLEKAGLAKKNSPSPRSR